MKLLEGVEMDEPLYLSDRGEVVAIATFTEIILLANKGLNYTQKTKELADIRKSISN